MAGRLVPDGPDLCFVPRFPFVDGTPYTVTVAGASAVVLVRPRPGRAGVTKVVGIYPTAAQVPVNLLRLYVWFSAPMSEGFAGRQVRLARDDGSVLAGALLPADDELWDAARRRLTVLLDPARIKRGLADHDAEGYPLSPGEPFRLIVGSGFLDRRDSPSKRPRSGATTSAATSAATSRPGTGGCRSRTLAPPGRCGSALTAPSTTACSAGACRWPDLTAAPFPAHRGSATKSGPGS
jgi:hypothetical protein